MQLTNNGKGVCQKSFDTLTVANCSAAARWVFLMVLLTVLPTTVLQT